MTPMTAIVDTQTGEFLDSGRAEDARFVRVTVPRNPDPATEKYSGNPGDPIAAKSGVEIAAFASARADADAAMQFDGTKMLKAVVIAALWGRLGRQPTPAEIATERTRILSVFKAL